MVVWRCQWHLIEFRTLIGTYEDWVFDTHDSLVDLTKNSIFYYFIIIFFYFNYSFKWFDLSIIDRNDLYDVFVRAIILIQHFFHFSLRFSFTARLLSGWNFCLLLKCIIVANELLVQVRLCRSLIWLDTGILFYLFFCLFSAQIICILCRLQWIVLQWVVFLWIDRISICVFYVRSLYVQCDLVYGRCCCWCVCVCLCCVHITMHWCATRARWKRCACV